VNEILHIVAAVKTSAGRRYNIFSIIISLTGQSVLLILRAGNRKHYSSEGKMETRRNFIKKSAITCATLCLPVHVASESRAAQPDLKIRSPRNALVLFYSQTGFTHRYANLIGCILQERGLTVDMRDLQQFEKNRFPHYDLIVVGTPVFYYDIPVNVDEWLRTIPPITGTPVAGFVSFGGPEGNQHNAVCNMMSRLTAKGGVPVGMDAYMNMASYPASWDSPKQIAHRHLPDGATYDQVRLFARQIMERTAGGVTISVEKEVALREFLRLLPLAWLNKQAISKHTIDGNKCIGCQTCVSKCPAGAISPARRTVDKEKCLTCFGCLNNCPAGAVVMEYSGKRLYGFPEFLRRNNLKVMEPVELRTCRLL
jgi:ferredoxin/flavodoxin